MTEQPRPAIPPHHEVCATCRAWAWVFSTFLCASQNSPAYAAETWPLFRCEEYCRSRPAAP